MKKITLLFTMTFFATGMNAQYCIPSNNCTDDDLITNVDFAGIQNPSGCGTDGYTDYTETVDPAQVEAGGTYSFSADVGAGWSDETVSLWIDFDNSQTFDIGEFYVIGTGSGNTVTGDITIPGNVENGVYRMRVAVFASINPMEDPCFINSVNYGEFEDYSVAVGTVSISDFDFSNAVTAFKSGNSLIVNGNNHQLNSVQVYDITGKLIASQSNINNTNASIDLSIAKQVILVSIVSADGIKTTKKVVF